MTPFGSGACSVHFATPACDSARVQGHPWKASPSSGANMDLLALRRQQKLIHGQSSLWLLLSLLWPIPTWKFAVGDDQTESANSQSFARNLPHPCSSLSLSKFWQPQAKVAVTPKLPTHLLQTCLAIITLSLPYLHKKKKTNGMLCCCLFRSSLCNRTCEPTETLQQLVDRRCPQPRWTSMCLKTLSFRQVVKHRGLPANGETHQVPGKPLTYPSFSWRKKNKKAPASIIIVSKQISCYIFILIRIFCSIRIYLSSYRVPYLYLNRYVYVYIYIHIHTPFWSDIF